MSKAEIGGTGKLQSGRWRLWFLLGLVFGSLLLAAFSGASAQAEDWPVPDGQTMKQYTQKDGALEQEIDVVIDRQKGEMGQEVSSNIEAWSKGRQQSQFDRGFDGKKDAYDISKVEMKDHMGTLENPKDCGEPFKIEGGCECPEFVPEFFLHYYVYYMPYEISCGTQVPWATAYEKKDRIKDWVDSSTDELYNQAPEVEKQVLQKAAKQSKSRTWGYDSLVQEVDQNALDLMKNQDKQVRFRSFSGGGRVYMYWHVYNTGDPTDDIKTFHEEYREEEAYKILWVHDGAVYPQYPEIPIKEVPTFLGESAEAIKYSLWSYPTYIDSDLKDFAFKEDDPEQCRGEQGFRYKADDGHTPDDILSDDQKEKLDQTTLNTDKEQKCLPNGYKRGPFNLLDQVYGPSGALVAYDRGFNYVTIKHSDKYHPYNYEGTTDPLSMDTIRDRMQELTRPPGGNEKLTEGCIYNEEEKFIPKKWGAEYGDANMSLTQYGYYRFCVVKWRLQRGCHSPCWKKPYLPDPITS